MRFYMYLLEWNDYIAVFPNMDEAVAFVEREVKKLGGHIKTKIEEEKYCTLYCHYMRGESDAAFINEVDYYPVSC